MEQQHLIAPSDQAALLARGGETADYLLALKDHMTFVANVENMCVYESRTAEMYTKTGVVTLAAHHYSTVVSMLTTTSQSLFRFVMEELFESIDAKVLLSRHALSVNAIVLPDPDASLLPREYLFAKVNTPIDESTFVSGWDSNAIIDAVIHHDTSARRSGIVRSGCVIRQDDLGVHVALSISAPPSDNNPSVLATLDMWLRGLRRLPHVCAAYLLSQSPLHRTAAATTASSCTTCGKLFSAATRQMLFCHTCGASHCGRCVKKHYLHHDGAVDEYRVCLGCYSNALDGQFAALDTLLVTARSGLSGARSDGATSTCDSTHPADVVMTPELLEDLRQRGLAASAHLMELAVAPMHLVKESNGTQLYSLASSHATTFKADFVAPAYDLELVLAMLAMAQSDLHNFVMTRLFGRLFVEGLVLAADNDDVDDTSVSLNWSVFESTGMQNCDLVYLKYNQRTTDETASSVWQSTPLPGSETWACALGKVRMPSATWGFLLERRGARDLHVSFIVSQPRKMLLFQENWMLRVCNACVSSFCGAVLSYHATRTLAPRGVMLFHDTTDTCYMCTKSFNMVLRPKQFCGECGEAVCARCCESTKMLQQGCSCDVRICRLCIGALASREPPSGGGSILSTTRMSMSSVGSVSNFPSSSTSSSTSSSAYHRPILHLSEPGDRVPLAKLRTSVIQPFVRRRNMRPYRETNPFGIDMTDCEDDDDRTYTMRGTITTSHAVQDVMEIFHMGTTESFRFVMSVLFGSLFVDGRVLHAGPDSSVNWLVLRNPKNVALEHCDYVFLKVNQTDLTKSAFSVWESVDLATHPPMPRSQSVPVQRLTMRRTGFLVEEADGGGVHIHFMTSASVSASAATKSWMYALVRCVRHVTEAVLCLQLSSKVGTTAQALVHRNDCVLCAKSFNLLRPKQHCAICGHPVCKKCSATKRLLHAANTRDLRVCFLCCNATATEKTKPGNGPPRLRRNITGDPAALTRRPL
ncbi:Aste57867_22195 [Aphanomyces stellatus]|uniref:Aste57867_22195 protein n=1 Tax=Aphanomyces stellatus TaxID=120398 RepID=A0A485LJI7_9STRA|nr:hypothetical protein As57867_022126 [Aphanomyces stellatus]VFT98862.1 Aste57867_22195 [Aphanomyces stellatus]